jgi:hypothetical protein
MKRPLAVVGVLAVPVKALIAIGLALVVVTGCWPGPQPLCGGTHTVHPDGRVECTGGVPEPQ